MIFDIALNDKDKTVTMIKNQLFPVIDYRNGRYQGEAKNNTPNGVGFFMDKNFMLCLAEWISGEIQGHAIVIYPSGKIFCGKVQHKKHEGIYSYELAEDHAQLICSARNSANKKSRLVAILPLFKTILEIDNSPSSQATILRQYEYSLANEQVNLNTAATILDLDKDDQRQLFAHKNFIQFFKEKFDGPFPQHFEYFVNENKGQKKEYFIGLRGEGLGIKIQPTEQLSMNKKKTEHVYVIKAMGYFTKENQLRQMGIKTHDNNVKGLIIEQGIFSLPNTLMKYEPGKRPPICFHNFHNHMKRSLFYRDKVLDIDFLYQFQKEFKGFRNNFKKIEIQRIAQFTIQNPINNNQVLNQIQNNRKHKTQALQNIRQLIEVKTPIQNPYNFVEPKQLHPQLNINRVKQDIYRSLSKLKHNPISNSKEYLNTSYRQIPRIQKPIKKQVSPLSKLNTIPISHQPFSPFKNPTPSQGVSQVDNNESLYRQPFNPFSPFKNSTPSYGVSRMNNNESLSPHKPNKSKSPYSYLEDAYVQKRPLFQKTNTQLHRDISKRQFNYLNDENKYRSPKPRTTTVLPMSDKHFDRSFVERSTDYKASKGLSRPNYSYYFAENEERDRMDKINISPFRQRI